MLSYRKIIQKNRKAQVGETLTWIAATLVIIGIIVVFIFLSVLMSKVKDVTIGDVRTDLPKKVNLLDAKTSLAHQATGSRNKQIIEDILENENK
jgi:Na+-transporting methylmalonyl-CoA/oxaloacetate decarboxylase gamma subunit